MKRRDFLKVLAIGGGMVCLPGRFISSQVPAAPFDNEMQKTDAVPANYYRIVVLGDPHLPSRTREYPSLQTRQHIMDGKNALIDDINAWEDVGQIDVLGDVVAQFANDEEYAYCKTYFDQLKKPVHFVNGNHDYIYTSAFSPKQHFITADAAMRQQKLERFKQTWGLSELFYTQRQGKYLLVYLSVDSLDAPVNLTEMSPGQLDWLRKTLHANQTTPTIIFFHGPLNGTLSNATNKFANTPRFIAQPEEQIRDIIYDNDQILLWVSGHTHTPATDPAYAADINLYEGRVTNIHNADLDRKNIWTNSLYLYSDKIVVRTFDHGRKTWLDNLDRTFIVPNRSK
ncbi:MAG TPA: metallophosphoesterase [Patescibacteria group bacterium]|nr:metallophosphoesterase [Patescibacteria group bacterium]